MARSDEVSAMRISLATPEAAFPADPAVHGGVTPGAPFIYRHRSFREFGRDETGAVTVEFTVLVPLFVLLMVFFTDASIIYLTNSEMYSNARDIARRMSVEEITTVDQARDYAAANLFLGNREYQVEAAFGADMTVTISLPVAEAAIFGSFMTGLIGRQLSVNATVRREPFE